MIAAPVNTKTRILDAAERLFAKKGFEETSLRDITAEAQVNLAAVNYHFQTKEHLIDAVIARRLEPVNKRRLEMLDAAAKALSVEQIIEAFLVPVLEADIPNVGALIGRVLSNPAEFAVRVFKKQLIPVAQRFDEAIATVLPGLSASERFFRLYFMAGAMTHVLAMWNVLPLMTPPQVEPPQHRREVVPQMVRFLAAGFRAPSAEETSREMTGERN